MSPNAILGPLTTHRPPSKNDISDLGPLKLFMGVFRVSILTLRLIFVCAQIENCKIENCKIENCQIENCKIAKCDPIKMKIRHPFIF